jgi:RNA polymerase subunit RPABC4/transcription elongation factor Spt4
MKEDHYKFTACNNLVRVVFITLKYQFHSFILIFRIIPAAFPLHVIQKKCTKENRSRPIYEQIPSNYIDMTIEEWYDMGIIKHPELSHLSRRKAVRIQATCRQCAEKSFSSYADINSHLTSKLH